MGGTHFLQTGYLLLNRNAPCILYSLSSIVNPEWVGSKGFVKAFCEKIYTMYTKEVNGKHFFHEKPDNRQDRDL